MSDQAIFHLASGVVGGVSILAGAYIAAKKGDGWGWFLLVGFLLVA